MMFLSKLVLLLATAAVSVQGDAIEARNVAKRAVRPNPSNGHWIDAWASMPQLTEPANLPPAPFNQTGAVFVNSTIRQTLFVTAAAGQIRLKFSNVFGGSILPITAVTVALPLNNTAGIHQIQTKTIQKVTFSGKDSINIPNGALAVSDPINFPIKAQQVITVTAYLATGQTTNSITSHPGSRTTSWFQFGNAVSAPAIDVTSPSTQAAAHWYFLSSIEAWVPKTQGSFLIVGDSITDGRGSTTDGNNRWPDRLLARLQKSGSTKQISFGNLAAGGNKILADGLGPNAFGRIDRDVLAHPGVQYAMIFEGVNDIGTSTNTSAAQAVLYDSLTQAYTQIASLVHAHGIPIFAATITPFSAPANVTIQPYSDPEREKTRQKINTFIRTSGVFDAVADFDKVLADPKIPSQLNPLYDGGDYLHPNVAGYQLLADKFPVGVFGQWKNGSLRASRQASSFTTASTNSKKRKIVTPARDTSRDRRHSPNVGTGVGSPRSSPHPSASPPRYLPPHLHDEVLPTDTSDAGSSTARDTYTGASSPSEAYANLTLDSREGSAPASERARTTAQPDQRPPPRSSSPAKRLHSDMDDDTPNPDNAASSRNSRQASPRTTKAAATAAAIPTPQRSARATSIEMVDAPNNSGSSETDVSNAGSSATSPDQSNLPSVDEQVARVMGMMDGRLQDRQEGYVISEKWLERVWSRTSENVSRPQEFAKDATLGPIGPVDNSELVDRDALQEDLADPRGDDFIPLSKAATIHQDFEVLPAKAWELVVGWHGLKEGSPVIRRYAHNTVPDNSSENIIWELHPPIFTIRKVRKSPPTSLETANPSVKLVASRHESFLSFVEAAKKSAGIDLNNKVRIWRILETASSNEPQPLQPSGILTPDASPRGGSPATSASRTPLILDVASFSGLKFGTERELVTGRNEKANEDVNEFITLDDAGLTQDQIIVLEEHDEKGEYVSDTTKTAMKSQNSSQLTKGLQSNPNSGRSTPTSGALTRGRTRAGKVRGHVGLTNLGNTCYMNSALQCLRSVEELSMYFLNNKWKEEINADNPIGHKGAIAKVYAGLLESIYSTGNASSFAPKNFKQTLGKANSLFSGYGQQDSQEFVSWLVDALHEDLNRVHVKPYRENPDSDDNTFRDPNAIRALGETYRSNHRARNDSVATDLFSGFYKNTMVCPECEKVSITFDPYSQLTLQLPIEQTWTHTITYIPLHGKPYQLEIDIDKNASIKTLKEFVGRKGGGVPANRIMASEVYSHKFYRHLDDKSTIAESNIGVRDDMYFYELDQAPSNWPAPKKKGSKYKMLMHGSSDEDIPDTSSPLHDRVVIPVFHRGPSVSSYRAQNFAMALWPFHIVLTREESKDYDTILRKVLAKVAQMTTRPILEELSGDSPLKQSRPGSDVVLTTEEDASPDDPQVKDGSMEGEDMVEVTMADAQTPAQQPSTSAAGQHELPEVLRPLSYIHPEFRQLFELKHTKKSSEIVTTGWSTVDHSRTLESITNRIRKRPSREESAQSSTGGSDTTSSDEDEDTSKIDAAAAIEAATVSSDEEMQSIEHESPAGARSGRGKKNKKARKQQRKQERKHKNNKNFRSKRVPDQPNYPEDPEDENDESLVRMGEALVLEWNPDAYDGLFGGSTEDDPRGMDAMKFIETLDDPEILDKKAKRVARRKHGITLDECFTESSKSEILSEDNAWYCSRCKELRRATKTLEIWTVPDILIIHLKRFSGHRSFRDKIEELIDFPVAGLDLSGKVGFPESKDLTYDLFAVDNHYGGLGGGHYTATAQNFFDKQWYDYNDSVVSLCTSGQKAVSRAAYLLFYRRRSSAPLGPPSLQQIVTADKSQDSDTSDADEPAGNGLRLGDSSRNGSSRAGAVAAGVGAQRGQAGGSQHLTAGTRQKNGVAAGVASLSEDDDVMDTGLPQYQDEGYDDTQDDGATYNSYEDVNTYGSANMFDEPVWSFTTLGDRANGDSDDAASDVPALGSIGGDDLSSRMLEDFGDDVGPLPGRSTPEEGIVGLVPVLGGEGREDDVAEIRIEG